MSVHIYQSTWRHVREESIPHVLFIFWGSSQRFPNFNLMEHQHSASRTTVFHHWNQEMVVFHKFVLKILIARILSGLYFSCNILYLSHPSSHVQNNSLFSTSHVHQKKIFIMSYHSTKMFTCVKNWNTWGTYCSEQWLRLNWTWLVEVAQLTQIITCPVFCKTVWKII